MKILYETADNVVKYSKLKNLHIYLIRSNIFKQANCIYIYVSNQINYLTEISFKNLVTFNSNKSFFLGKEYWIETEFDFKFWTKFTDIL